MAQRRMFSLNVVDTDRFLELPPGAQLLYFHLGMRADDDGFVASPKRIVRYLRCREKDLQLLIDRGLLIALTAGWWPLRTGSATTPSGRTGTAAPSICGKSVCSG